MKEFFQGQLWEKYSVFFWAFLVGVISYYAEKHFQISLPAGETLYSSLVALGGIFAAFTVSIKTFVISNRNIISSLKENNYKDLYFSYIKFSIDSSILLCLISVSGFSHTVSNWLYFDNLLITILTGALCGLRRLTNVTFLLASAES